MPDVERITANAVGRTGKNGTPDNPRSGIDRASSRRAMREAALALRPELRSAETDEEYFARRERDELVLAMSAPNGVTRDLHLMLANEYRAKLASLASRGNEQLGER